MINPRKSISKKRLEHSIYMEVLEVQYTNKIIPKVTKVSCSSEITLITKLPAKAAVKLVFKNVTPQG